MNRFLMRFSVKTFCSGMVMMLVSMMALGQTADFTIDEPTGCAAHTILCTYTGNGASTWSWTVNTTPSPLSSGIPNPIFTIINPGIYTVTLTVDGGASTSQQVTVYQNPVPNFVSDNSSGCAPIQVCFSGSTTGGAAIMDWSWNLGVQSIQTGQFPCVTYNENSNAINIQLVVEDVNGCEGVIEKPGFITINKPPVPSFNVTIGSSCTSPFSPQITNTTFQDPEFNYSWNFPGATGTTTSNTYAPDVITYDGNNSYNITLTTEDNGCTDDTTVVGAVVIDELDVDFSISNPTPCQFGQVTFTAMSNLSGVNYQWFHGPTAVGSNSPVLIRTFNNAGIQSIRLVVTTIDGLCTDEVTKTIDVKVGPTTDFSADATSSCGAYTANFTSVTTGATSYAWTVTPSGQSSTLANPSFLFTNSGSYSVSLTTTSANGCTRTINKPNYITVSNNVNVNITSNVRDNEGCVPLAIQLGINGNLPNGVNITGVSWNLPGGTPNTASGQTINTTYNSTGTFTATATVSFSGGCSQTVTSTIIKVGNLPNLTSNLNPTDLCLNETIIGTATSDIANTNFNWFFEGGGNPTYGGTGTNPAPTPYTYVALWSNYDVLLVGESGGCRDTIITEVVVNAPGASFTYVQSCDPKSEITLVPNIQQGVFADVVNWTINGPGGTQTFGPYSNINQAGITVDLGIIAIYDIELSVSSSFTGCSDENVQTINLNNSQSAAVISPSSLCPGESASFSENSNFDTWQWVFGNGDTSEIADNPTTFNAQYDSTGVFQAILFTVNNSGCRDTFYHDIYVGGGFADIGGTLGACLPPLNTSFNVSPSVFFQGGVDSANWLIDDGTGTLVPFNNTLNPGPFNYTSEGNYNVYLEAFDSIGCRDDTTVIVNVGDVFANFTSNVRDICPGQLVKFTNLTLGGNLAYQWTITGGNPGVTITSTEQNPEIIFPNTGVYNVTLTAADTVSPGSCSDDTTVIAYIDASGSGFDIVATNTFKTCPPLITEFSLTPPTNINSIEHIVWYVEASNGTGTVVLGDDSIQNLTSNVPWIYTGGGPDGAGFFDVTAFVTTSDGCIEPVYKNDFIFVGGPTGDFSFTPSTVCVPGDVVFTAIDIARTDSILWDFGDGTTQETSVSVGSVTATYDFPGLYSPKVILEKDGCTVVLEPDDGIRASNIRAEAMISNDFLCDEGSIQFNASSQIDSAATTGDFTATTNWVFGDGTTSDELNPLHNYTGNVFGDLNVTFTATTDFGCMDDTTFIVSIYETPDGVVGPDPTICNVPGGSVELFASGATNYQWSPANQIVNPTSATPTVLASDTTQFQVIIYNNIECPDTQFSTVNVIEKIEGVAGTSTQICAGQTAQLMAEATVFPVGTNLTYEWFPAVGLTNPNIANPIAAPTTSVTYQVVINSDNCDPFTQNVTILVDGASFVNAGEDQIIVAGASADLAAFSPGNFNFNWFDSEGNFIDNTQTINTGPLAQSTSYYVEVGDNACRSTDVVNVIILETCDDGQVTIPNVFTPNGDGINDEFKIETGLGVSYVSGLKIFNRWGEIVFESEGVTDGWDGTQSGKSLDPGVFVYSIEVTCSNNTTSIRKGNITLLK